MFTSGVASFGVASVLCAAAPDATTLIVFRGVQGVAGALLTPASLAVITSTFSGPERGAAIGQWTAWSGISFVIGPLVGGWLIGISSWRLDLPHQRADRGRDGRSLVAATSGSSTRDTEGGRPRRLARALRSCAAGLGPARRRLHRAAAARLERPARAGRDRGGLRAPRRVRPLRDAHADADAAAPALPAAQLLGHERRDARRLRRAVGVGRLPHALPPAARPATRRSAPASRRCR